MHGHRRLKLAFLPRGPGADDHPRGGCVDALHLRRYLDLHAQQTRALHKLLDEVRLKAL